MLNAGTGKSWPYPYTNTTITVTENGTRTFLHRVISFDAPSVTGLGSLTSMLDSEEAWSQSGLDIFGPCSSYAHGGMNYGWCYWDFACGICRRSCWQECSYTFLGNG